MRAETTGEAAADARAAYSQKVAATYDFHFGKDQPFLPSNAETDNGEFMEGTSFPTAAYCGHCHQAAHAQWRESAHANSNRPPWYQKNVELLQHEKGVAFTRHCEGCHNPIALLSGALTTGQPEHHTYDEDGITCSVCHSIKSIDTRGTGSYVMGTPAVLVDENGAPIRRPVSDAEVLAHLDRHSAAVMKPFYRTSEFCATCHKAALPRELNDYKWQRAMSPYDEWQSASFAKESPLPFYVKPAVSTCETCHMQREALTGRDPGAKNGQLASHRWLGANSLIPAFYGYTEQAARLRQFLQNNSLNVDLFGLQRSTRAGGAKAPGDLIAPLGTAPFRVEPGDRLTISIVVQNRGIGHSYVPEQRDFYESWIEFKVLDAQHKVLVESGSLGPEGGLDPSAHSFTNRLIDKTGKLVDLHQVWNNRVVAYNNTIQSGRSQLVRYQFTVPRSAKGELTIAATVRYRRFNQHFIDFGLQPGYAQPVLDVATASRTLHIGENVATPPDAGANPEWMRWNNYGIGLLDALQYGASTEAFERVAALRPDYADAYTNMAIAEIQWERYNQALPHLQKALALDANNARALYYMALVERSFGHLDAAVGDLQRVVTQYPRSRDAHRELGFTLYSQQRYPDAIKQYQALQGIDPDDLAAHYNLAILYRRLGEKDKARMESLRFADEKNDPTASTYALDYLWKHREVALEAYPWHVHDLDAGSVADSPAVTVDLVPSQQIP